MFSANGMRSIRCILLSCMYLLLHNLTEEAFDASQYSRSQQLHPDLKIFWKIDTQAVRIKLAIQANATGWVGFGLAEAGAMQGADIVYYVASTNKLVDAYSLDFVQPTPDTQQDWTLISGSSVGGVTTVEAQRALNTGDSQDIVLTDDSWPAIEATRVICAFGNGDFANHGMSNRAMGQVRFFTPPPTDPLEAIKADSNVKKVTMMQNNFAIPNTRTTTYDHQCVPLSSLNGGNITASGKQHLLAIEFVADPRSSNNVHHLTVQCFKASSDPYWPAAYYASYIPQEYTGTLCNQNSPGPLVWAWAKGVNYLAFPDNVGIPISTDSGCDYIQLQFHYDNSQRTANRVDSSGLILYYAAPRSIDAGVLQLGDPNVALFGTKLAKGFVRESFNCTGFTTKFAVPYITVFYRGFHMHRTGQRMVTRQYSQSAALVRADSVEFWNTDIGALYNPSSTGKGYKISKGDWFQVDCYYNPTDASTVWGLGSEQEMCIDFIYYYPLQTSLGDGICAVPFPSARRAAGPGSFVGETCAPTSSSRSSLGNCLSAARLQVDANISGGFGSCANPPVQAISGCPAAVTRPILPSSGPAGRAHGGISLVVVSLSVAAVLCALRV